MNILDWSKNDNLGVSLGNSVYLWSFKTGNVEKLSVYKNYNIPTSLTFDMFSETMAVGTMSGSIEIKDLEKKSTVRTLGGHLQRVGSVSLAGNYLISGSRDHSILFYDL